MRHSEARKSNKKHSSNGCGSKKVPKKPTVGKRKNRVKPVVPKGGIFLTAQMPKTVCFCLFSSGPQVSPHRNCRYLRSPLHTSARLPATTSCLAKGLSFSLNFLCVELFVVDIFGVLFL